MHLNADVKPGRGITEAERAWDDEIEKIRDMEFGGCIDRLPDVEDAFWDKHGQKAFPELLQWFSQKIDPMRKHVDLTETYQTIKCLAILVRLAKTSDCPILSKFSLDRRFITELIPPQNASLLIAPRMEEAQSLQKHIRYLIENTEENGLFQEFCGPEKCQNLYLDTANKTPPKGSLVAVVNTLFQDLKIYTRFNQEGYGSRLEMVEKCLAEVSKNFSYMQQCVYHLQTHFHAEEVWSSYATFAYRGSPPPMWKSSRGIDSDRLMFSYLRAEENTKALHGSYSNITEQFLGWLQPISEREIHAQREYDGVDVQFRLVSSKDDPSLRVENLLELFSTHQELMQREEYRKFFFITLFQVSLKDGKIPLEEFLKNHPDGITLLTRFIAQGVKAYSQDTEIAGFFFHMGLACAEYEQAICQKKEIPFSIETLIRGWQKSEAEYLEGMRKIQEIESKPKSYGDEGEKQTQKKEEIDRQRLKCFDQRKLWESYITRYASLVGTPEVMKKIFSSVSSDVWGGRINGPDWLRAWRPRLGEAYKRYLDQMEKFSRNQFFSQFVFGSNGPTSGPISRWNYAYPYAYTSDGTWAIHLEDGTIRLQGEEIYSFKLNLQILDSSKLDRIELDALKIVGDS